MHSTRYLLFGISILSSTGVILTNRYWSGRDDEYEVSNDKNNCENPEPETSTASKSLTFIVAENEVFTLTLNKLVTVNPPTSGTEGSLTGGIFGDATLVYRTFTFEWEVNSEGVQFNASVIFSNNDGPVRVIVPVNANGNEDNPKFDVFQTAMAKIQKPGDSTPIHSGDSYSWFKNFPQNANYIFFRSLCFDQDTNESYDCNTILLPLEDDNFMSKDQFQTTFARIPVSDLPPDAPPLTPEKVEDGVTVFPV